MFCFQPGIPGALAQDAIALRAIHADLHAQLTRNQFRRPLYLESSETRQEIQGDIYALIEQPFAVVGPALHDMGNWCDILILHLNVKSCRASTPEAGDTLSLNIGRKYEQSLADAYLFEFLYSVLDATPAYLQVGLNADEGPMGTSRYRVALEVVELDSGRSFLHLSYSYAYGILARITMQGYLATIGHDKVGFSIVGQDLDGQPVHIGGLRGVVERNTMRYYLAIDAFLGALSLPASEQTEQRLNDWYAGAERYPTQLNELERGEYLDMKRNEIRRQQAPGRAAD